MDAAEFQPGFRMSFVDGIVLVVGVVGAVVGWHWMWWVGFITAFVVAHFYLFCNVFRIARPLELIWACCFVAMTYGTIAHGVPSWPTTIAGMLILTTVVIGIEMRKPSYHGVLWQRVNPGLLEWWSRRQGR